MTTPDEPTSEKSSGVPDMPGWAAFAVMGSTIAICEALGVGGGLWCDHEFGTAPAGIFVGVVLGTVLAVVSVVQQIRKYL